MSRSHARVGSYMQDELFWRGTSHNRRFVVIRMVIRGDREWLLARSVEVHN
jgi:hypothetical protein